MTGHTAKTAIRPIANRLTEDVRSLHFRLLSTEAAGTFD